MKPACLPYDYDFGLDEESQLDPGGTEVRDMLKNKVHRVDRNKSALSQVRIETFKGSRSIESGKTMEAQRALFRLAEELAMLISPPLVRPELWCHGARADEHIPAAARMPDGSIYPATLKRLRQEYLKEDGETVISDKSFAQRMLYALGYTNC